MKIGFDAKRLFCNNTGLGNYSRTLAGNLQKYFPNNEYHLYSPEVRRSPSTLHFLDASRFQTHTPKTRFSAFWRSYSIKNQLKADKIELFHGLSHEIPVNLAKTPVKSVVTIHDLIFRIYPETYSFTDRKIYDLKFRYACEHASRIIAISENTKNDIIRFYRIAPEKIEVIYQACNPAYYQIMNEEDATAILAPFNLPADFLLSVGSVEARKNLKRVIESYQFLKPDLRIPLVIVGKGSRYKEESQLMVRKAGLEKLFIWIDGPTGTDQVQSMYQKARALVYPSLYEGFGLPVAESLLCKTPVITSNRSSLMEAGGPGSLYVNPESPQEIAAAIEKVLSDNDLRQRMINIGYDYAHQTFSPERLTGQVMDCYLQNCL